MAEKVKPVSAETVRADFNDPVKKGQVIAKLDPIIYKATLDSAKANLDQAVANVDKAGVGEMALDAAPVALGDLVFGEGGEEAGAVGGWF